MARYKYSDNSQGLLLQVNLKEQLLLGTFEWTLDYLIEKIDLSVYDKKYNNDAMGAAAYSPRILLKIVLYCYSKGILSSRRMQAACRENIIVKALAHDSEPDHSTLAAFVSGNTEAVKDLFLQVLMKCQSLDLISGEMFAIDGCKLPSNASKKWSGKIADLKKKKKDLEKHLEKMLRMHKELDKDEKAKQKQEPFRKTLGEDKDRRARHIERLEKNLKKLDEFLESAQPKMGISGEEVQTNITDPQSAYIKSSGGYIQGYNGIAIADSGNQVIISVKAIGSGAESGCFPEMLDNLEKNMQMITKKKKPLSKSICLGDTGYFSEENLQEAKKRKINVLIPDQQFRKRDTSFEWREKKAEKKKFGIEDFTYDKKADRYICPAGKVLNYKCKVKLRNNEGRQYRASSVECNGCALREKCIKRKGVRKSGRTLYIVEKKYKNNLSEKMKKKIDDPAYREIYSRRIQIIEPVFSNICCWKDMDEFLLRTQEKVNSQWELFAIVHNISKCIKPLALKYGK